MKKWTLYVTAILFFFLAGCAKDGVDGKDGIDGEQGPPGTANVIYSGWFLTGNGWVESTETTTPFYGEFAYFNRPVTGLSQGILDNGAILCYMKGDPLLAPNTSSTVFQLPYTIGAGFDFTDQFDFAATSGNLRFLYKSDDPWEASELGGISFRYILIPGGVAGRGVTPLYNGYSLDELKEMSYEQVATLFHIPAEGTNMN